MFSKTDKSGCIRTRVLTFSNQKHLRTSVYKACIMATTNFLKTLCSLPPTSAEYTTQKASSNHQMIQHFMILQLRHTSLITQSVKEIRSGHETGLIDISSLIFHGYPKKRFRFVTELCSSLLLISKIKQTLISVI